jgi:hypothetical protein
MRITKCAGDDKEKGYSLDTLAQLRKVSQKTLLSRARAKYFSSALAVGLASLRSPLEASYRNSFYCAFQLSLYDNGTTTTRYCKNRWCLVCARIRLADHINRYVPVVQSWPNRCFVTLTIPNVPERLLKNSVDVMFMNFRRIQDVVRKSGVPLVGIRKLECTYNANRDDFHPHFHAIVQDRAQADFLVSEWLVRYPEARLVAQDIRNADAGDVMELFKYFTKVVTKTDGHARVYLMALDTMFRALRSRRVFQPFGFRLPKAVSEQENVDFDKLLLSRFDWLQSAHDWVNQHGDRLSGYNPNDAFDALVKGIIETP